MATTGRPSKLTPDLQQQIVDLIAAGNYPEVAAGACGVNRRTFYEWMQRGLGEHPKRPKTKRHSRFAHAISEAIDQSEARIVVRLAEFESGRRKGQRKAWIKSNITMAQSIAMQWKLSRRFPDRWGQRPATAAVAVNAGGDEKDHGVTISITYAQPEGGSAT